MPIDESSPFRKKEFIFGVATSSYQIEGAHDLDGRTPSIWDTFCREEGRVANGDNGDIACDHYHRWKEDLALIKSLGVDSYRFSIAWPRIIRPDGSIIEAGLRFYENIIEELERLEIKPNVTLYHWDLPQFLEDEGGWLNRDTCDAFAKYTEVVSERFGDRVSIYATFNEPWCSSILSYLHGLHAPGYRDRKKALQAAHHLLLAHGLAMPILRKNAPKAMHGIVLNMSPFYAKGDSADNLELAKLAHSENNEWFIEPLLLGRYPTLASDYYRDDLPTVEEGDLEIISRPIDFIGLNYYTREVVKRNSEGGLQPYVSEVPEGAETTEMGWEIYPEELTRLLVELNLAYDLPTFHISENGMADADKIANGEIADTRRERYLQTHLQAVENAIAQGVDVQGYFAWSLMDNFEWALGYEKRFGLIYVDYETQERTLKNSAFFFRDFIKEAKNTK